MGLKTRIRTTGLIDHQYEIKENHFNTVLFEDEKKNAMHESIELFAEICNSKWFRKTEMILFLNKNDLYREMLREGISLKNCFGVDSGFEWDGEQWDTESKQSDMIDYVKQDDIAKDNEFFEICYDRSIEFIQEQYVQRNKYKEKLIYVHDTTANNRDNIEKVFWDVQNIIIRLNLKRGGIV